MSQLIIKEHLHYLPSKLQEEIGEISILKNFKKGDVLINTDDIVKYVPIVISGLIKVFTQHQDKELLLYYIEPRQSCVMSYSSAIHNQKSKIFAEVEEDSSIILMPQEELKLLSEKSVSLNLLIFDLFHIRYTELLETINQLLFNKLDVRLLDYLKLKLEVGKSDFIKISHQQIANEIGTAREVISRTLKKLEAENKIKISENGINISK